MNLLTMKLAEDSAELVRKKFKTAIIFPGQDVFNFSYVHLVCSGGTISNGDYFIGGPLVKVILYRFLTISEITEDMKEKLQGDPVELLYKANPDNDGFPNHTRITYVEFELIISENK